MQKPSRQVCFRDTRDGASSRGLLEAMVGFSVELRRAKMHYPFKIVRGSRKQCFGAILVRLGCKRQRRVDVDGISPSPQNARSRSAARGLVPTKRTP
jgi:hypothetical protein